MMKRLERLIIHRLAGHLPPGLDCAFLQHCPLLRTFQHSQLHSLGNIAACNRLEELIVPDFRGGQSCIDTLQHLSNLQCLHLSGCEVTLPAGSNFPKLRKLRMYNSSLSSLGVLERSSSLVFLDIACSRVVDLSGISGCIYLRYLDISYCNIIREGLERLPSNLRRVKMVKTPLSTDDRCNYFSGKSIDALRHKTVILW